jgi:hypothetical protein
MRVWRKLAGRFAERSERLGKAVRERLGLGLNIKDLAVMH